jgi:hypothetical protein
VISTENQSELSTWLCERIGLVASPALRCIGVLRNSTIVGCVGFDQHNGASLVMHCAGEAGWLTLKFLRVVFQYAFNVCKVKMVIGLVPSGNKDALRFNTHLGFKTRLVLEDAHPDGALVLMTMLRGECRYIYKGEHGQEIITTPST